MPRSSQVTVALAVLCALLVGIIVGNRRGQGAESERYYARANKVLDAMAPDPVKQPSQQSTSIEKADLLRAAKAIAIGAISYSADHEGVLTGPHGFVEGLWPYMPKGEPNRLDSFEWTTRAERRLDLHLRKRAAS